MKAVWYRIEPEYFEAKSIFDDYQFKRGLAFFVSYTPEGWLVKSDSENPGGLFQVKDEDHLWFPEIMSDLYHRNQSKA